MLIEVKVLAQRLNGKLVGYIPIADVYTHVHLFIESGTEAYEYIASKINDCADDGLYNDIVWFIEDGENISLDGEAKDMCFTVGEFTSKIEDWKVKKEDE